MNYSITQNGKPLSKDKYTIDENTKTFSSTEDGLVLDFSGLNGWTFKTGSNCTFKTLSNCIFNTGFYCTFDTGYDCTFDTGYDCVFNTEFNCVIIRRDIYEVIEIPKNKKIKLNEFEIKGYTLIEEVKEVKEEMIIIDGKEVSKSTVKEALKSFFENI